jgi:hypothetical protein
MKSNHVKSFRFVGPVPNDVSNGIVDVFVTLNDNFEYWVEIVTPFALASMMEKDNFIQPGYPYIIVRELTPVIIREALEAFAGEREDAYWLKLYHLTVELNINDLNTLLDRYEKRLKQDEEDDQVEDEKED